jgi:hypothetical protein
VRSTKETLFPWKLPLAFSSRLRLLTFFPHVASASAEGADADKRALGEFDEGAGLTSNYLMRSAHFRSFGIWASMGKCSARASFRTSGEASTS